MLLCLAVPPADPVVEGAPLLRLKAHSPYNLTCRASGAKPAAEITWYRDGEIQPASFYSKVGPQIDQCRGPNMFWDENSPTK